MGCRKVFGGGIISIQKSASSFQCSDTQLIVNILIRQGQFPAQELKASEETDSD